MQIRSYESGEMPSRTPEGMWTPVALNDWGRTEGGVLGLEVEVGAYIVFALHDPRNDPLKALGYLGQFRLQHYTGHRHPMMDMAKRIDLDKITEETEVWLSGTGVVDIPQIPKWLQNRERERIRKNRIHALDIVDYLEIKHSNVHEQWGDDNNFVRRVEYDALQGTIAYEVGKIDPNEPPELTEPEDQP